MAVKFVDVSYKNVLKKVNFEIDKGQIVSLVGKNGSGKTTVFDLIYGQYLNFDGKIMLCKKTLDRTKKLGSIVKSLYKYFSGKTPYEEIRDTGYEWYPVPVQSLQHP